MDDLVKRLRDKWRHNEDDCYAAADRIEALERSLILISGFNEHSHPCKREIDEVISDVLGEKKDGE
mgnify:CR=1 FL=1